MRRSSDWIASWCRRQPFSLPALPRLLDALVAELVLDERDQAEDGLRHQVVEHQPLALHLVAQLARPLEVAGVDGLDRAVHRRAGELFELGGVEPCSDTARS